MAPQECSVAGSRKCHSGKEEQALKAVFSLTSEKYWFSRNTLPIFLHFVPDAKPINENVLEM